MAKNDKSYTNNVNSQPKPLTCKNCGHSSKGNFCKNCGQNSEIEKIDAKYVMHEIPNSIFQLDRGFLFTVKQLSLKPGQSIKDFLNGKRKPYYKPLAFFLVTSTIYFLLAYLMNRNTFIDSFLLGIKDSMADNNTPPGLDLLTWISKNQTYFILLFLPLYSLASYFAFIKSKYNYFEHLVINLYITGYQMIIYLVFSFVFFKQNIFLITPLIIGFIYNFWVFTQIFSNKRFLKKLLLIVLTYLIFIIELMALSIIIMLIIKKIL